MIVVLTVRVIEAMKTEEEVIKQRDMHFRKWKTETNLYEKEIHRRICHALDYVLSSN